jgi:hypothetical protein
MLAPLLSALESAHLLRRLAEPDPAYFFRHILIQESAYDTLLKNERRSLHRAVAATLERTTPDAVEELARHFAAGDTPLRAAHYYALAARRARSRTANPEAVFFYRAALAQLDLVTGGEREGRAELLEELGDVLAFTGQNQAARSAFQEARRLLHGDEQVISARLWRKEGDAWQNELQMDRAWELYERGEIQVEDSRSDTARDAWHEWLALRLAKLMILYWRTDWRGLGTAADEIQPLVERYATPALRAQFYDRLVGYYVKRDRYVMSPAIFALTTAMLAASEESKDPHERVNSYFSHGFYLLWDHQLDAADEALNLTLALAEQYADARFQEWCLTYLAVLERWRGRVDRVTHYVARSAAVAISPDSPWQGAGKANLAWVARRAGRSAEARALGERALVMWSPFGDLYPFEWVARFPLLALEVEAGNFAAALEHARRMLDLSQQKLADELALSLAAAAGAGGDTRAAISALSRAAATARQRNYV